MKIAVITEGTIVDKIGEGHELRLFEIFSRLAKENEVHIIQPAPSARVWQKAGITLHDIPPLRGSLGKRLFRNHFYLTRYIHAFNAPKVIRQIDPQVVDLFGFVFPSLPSKLAVVGSFAHYEKSPRLGSIAAYLSALVRRKLTKSKVSMSDYFVMMSVRTKTQFESSGWLAGKEFSYVPNGVDPKVFFPRDKLLSRTRLGLPEDMFVILLCGQLTEIKRPIQFLQGFMLLPDNYFAVLVGRGPLIDDVKDFVSQNGIGSRVRIAGYVEKELLPFYYSAADISAYMGELEIQPLVPQESMACGTPPVVSDAQGNNELVENGTSGALFRPADLNEFASTVRTICESKGLRERMSLAGVNFMKERNWDKTAELTMKAYMRAIELSKSTRMKTP